MVQAWAASGSGDGTAASPYIHALSWIDLDNYMPITGSTNLATTGTIQGGIKISSDADGMDASAMTTAGICWHNFLLHKAPGRSEISFRRASIFSIF